jgi:hypothetical protein
VVGRREGLGVVERDGRDVDVAGALVVLVGQRCPARAAEAAANWRRRPVDAELAGREREGGAVEGDPRHHEAQWQTMLCVGGALAR